MRQRVILVVVGMIALVAVRLKKRARSADGPQSVK
jgi:hypothetical protein